MIRVQVSERMVFEANEFLQDLHDPSFVDRHDYKEEHKLIGALGEIALIDYCWNNDLLAFKNEGRSSDVRLYSGHTIEVKTQKVSSAPLVHYVVNVASRQKDTEASDFMFFTRLQFVAGKADALWLLGGCSRDKFWRLARPNLAGDPMMDDDGHGNQTFSGRYYTTDAHTLSIAQLAPPSAALKHFKSLQEKEEAQ